MKRMIVTGLIACMCLRAECAQPSADIVRDGTANAVIVVREHPPRLLGLAALELRYYLEQMSGARLPIVHAPQPEGVNLFVGRSRFTDELDLGDDGLPYGAFHMVSGPGWLVLMGHDRDFLPPEPFQSDLSRAEARDAWDAMTAEVTESKWSGPPISAGLWDARGHFMRVMSERYGGEQVELVMTDRAPDWPGIGISRYDLGGSLNAVYGFLMDLGVRWYMPGDLGEVVPEKKTIALPAVNKTVHPHYALRTFNWSGFHTQPFDNIIWAQRIGMNSSREIWPFTWSHNLARVYGRAEMQAAHPEYYALVRGERNFGHACFSSEGLLRETVDYARFIFDRFDMPGIDLWPEDGLRGCQCDACQEEYDRGKNASDMVFGFVDRVARELYKTHPGRPVTCGAYTPYKDPPATIESFSPNAGVMVSNVGRTRLDRPEHMATFLAYMQAWQEKVAPGNLLRWENNFHNSRTPLSFPVIQTRAMAAELKALKGISQGEFHNWQMKPTFHNPANSHLTLYSLAQYLWDADRDVDDFLEEYYALFYGPARVEMRTALEYAQTGYRRIGRAPGAVDAAVRLRFVELLQTARERAGDTVYGARIQLMMDELTPLEELRRLAQAEAESSDPRANAPLLIGRDGADPDPTYWRIVRMGGAEVYGMRNLATGDHPAIETTFQVWWDDESLWFEFHCAEPDMAGLVSTDDVRDGDSVVVLLETQVFSYYHVQISPDGRIFEQAINPVSGMGQWSAQAEIEADQNDNHWRVRVRLPVSGDQGLDMDPNHQVAGSKPGGRNPWYVNVGRTRVRDGATTRYAFSPTGGDDFHDPDRFAYFVFGRPRR